MGKLLWEYWKGLVTIYLLIPVISVTHAIWMTEYHRLVTRALTKVGLGGLLDTALLILEGFTLIFSSSLALTFAIVVISWLTGKRMTSAALATGIASLAMLKALGSFGFPRIRFPERTKEPPPPPPPPPPPAVPERNIVLAGSTGINPIGVPRGGGHRSGSPRIPLGAPEIAGELPGRTEKKPAVVSGGGPPEKYTEKDTGRAYGGPPDKSSGEVSERRSGESTRGTSGEPPDRFSGGEVPERFGPSGSPGGATALPPLPSGGEGPVPDKVDKNLIRNDSVEDVRSHLAGLAKKRVSNGMGFERDGEGWMKNKSQVNTELSSVVFIQM